MGEGAPIRVDGDAVALPRMRGLIGLCARSLALLAHEPGRDHRRKGAIPDSANARGKPGAASAQARRMGRSFAILARRSTAKNPNYACARIKTPGHFGRSDE
jgi:hypothetical protein